METPWRSPQPGARLSAEGLAGELGAALATLSRGGCIDVHVFPIEAGHLAALEQAIEQVDRQLLARDRNRVARQGGCLRAGRQRAGWALSFRERCVNRLLH